MGFQGYKLKHKLIVFENIQDSVDPASVYAQTFEITLFISAAKTKFLRFDEMESTIVNTLGKYSKQILKQLSPFDQLEPTLENMGNFFYELLRQNLSRIDTSLEMLEISESPVRTYVVNETNRERRLVLGDKKIKISSIIVENIISQSVSHMVSSFEEQEPIPVSQSLQPSDVDAIEADTISIPVPEADAEAEVSFLSERSKTPDLVIQLSRDKNTAFQFAAGVFFLLLCGAAISFYLKSTGAYPAGADIYGHLFKSDLLYNSIKKGDFYPLYTELWYNGMQPFRYWAPLPYYLLAILQFFAGGDVLASYLLFVSFSFVIGGIGWLLWGLTYHRMMFCMFLGCVWFLLPDNMRVFFVEGNYPRMVIAIMLPYLFYFIWSIVEYRKKWAILPLIIVMGFITLSHAMIAAMTGITTFIFLLIYCLNQKRITESLYVIFAMLLSFALCGFWLLPALKGGLIDMDASATAEVMKALSTPIRISLNPFLRTEGIFLNFYYGISIILLSVAGLFLANKKSHPGFYTVVIVFLGTTTVMVPFLDKLPMNQLFWMTRFTPIVYSIFFLSLLEWKKCRRYVILIIALIILVDCMPSTRLFKYYSQTPSKISYSLNDAKELTKQRVSLLDSSGLGSYPSFNISAEEPKVQYTFGWAWQGATTSHNIVMLNTAMEKGYYYYLFDRSLELGDDTVIIYKELVEKAHKTRNSLVQSAKTLGYSLHKETNYTYIFHRNLPESFGTTAEYKGLAIGRSAQQITLEFPSFEEGASTNLSDYTFKELKKYKVIYLSGFTYDDREAAQKLLTQTANAGVKIIVDMNRIPVDPITSRMTFFDVTAQSISFSIRYPELMYHNEIYEAVPFKEEFSTWNTVYLENLDQIIGYSYFKNKQLPFLGTAGNPNIIFMGYNFLYHAMETNDQTIMALMSELVEIEPNQLPLREVVPIRIIHSRDKIVIDSPGGKVNTTIAYQDNFRSEQKISAQNNLLIVEEPQTEIKLVYPYLLQGLILSLTGLLGTVLLIYVIYKKRGVEIEEEIS